MVFFRVDEDPEILEYLCHNVAKKMPYFTTDEILTILVNLQHTLTPESIKIYLQANQEFAERLSSNFNPQQQDLYIQPEDLIKITTSLLDQNQMGENLKEQMIEYI